MTIQSLISIGSLLSRLVVVLFAATPTSPVLRYVEDFKACELMEAGVTFNYTKTIHFSYVPPDGSTLPPVGINTFGDIADTHNRSKLPAIFLPGLDGSGCFSAQSQFKDLSNSFELWRLTVDPTDRSTFKELVDTVALFLDDLVSTNSTTLDMSNREFVLIGEGFGGLLASCIPRMNTLKGLVLVSPDMAMNSTLWESLSSLLTTIPGEPKSKTRTVPSLFSIVEGLAVGLSDRRQLQHLLDEIRESPQGQSGDLKHLHALQQGFGMIEEALPVETISHRLYHWLYVGSSVVTSEKLRTLVVPTLVISGGGDMTVQNKKDQTSLLKEIPHCTRLEFDDLGHFLLRDNVNLTRLVLQSRIFSPYDPVLDWKPPPKELINKIKRDWIAPIQASTSPVFFSTDAKGKRHKGLGHVPPKRRSPILFVANHQLGGLDLQLYVAQLILDRGMFVRGLGHPVIFQGEQSKGPFTDMEWPFPVTKEEGGGEGITRKQGFYEKLGVVPVNPRNFYKLMESCQPVLLFPGGIREAFHGKNESYKLFWPEKVDFVRTAAKFNATIVPISAVGAADSATIVMDAEDIRRLPFGLGHGVEQSIFSLHRGRYDDNEHEIFHPPIILPKTLPARHYFLFGKPFSTERVSQKDKHALDKLYHDIKRELERGISDLLKARQKDPYRNTMKRILYEKVSGRTAPCFDLKELDD